MAKDEQLVEEIRAWLRELDEFYKFPHGLGYVENFESMLGNDSLRLGQILMSSSPIWLTDKIINSEYDCFYSDNSNVIRQTLNTLKGLMDLYA